MRPVNKSLREPLNFGCIVLRITLPVMMIRSILTSRNGPIVFRSRCSCRRSIHSTLHLQLFLSAYELACDTNRVQDEQHFGYSGFYRSIPQQPPPVLASCSTPSCIGFRRRVQLLHTVKQSPIFSRSMWSMTFLPKLSVVWCVFRNRWISCLRKIQ